MEKQPEGIVTVLAAGVLASLWSGPQIKPEEMLPRELSAEEPNEPTDPTSSDDEPNVHCLTKKN